MQPDAMTQMLKSLKLHGMAQALGELAEQDSPAYKSASPVLAGLLKAELAEREVRSLAYQMKVARFPAYRDMGGFDFSCSDANEALVRQLYLCEFIDLAHNIVLVGGPGTGKTHLATAIGVQALEHHRRRVRFFSTIELVNALEQEKLVGKPGQLATRLMYADLVVLDELGYRWCAPVPPAQQALRTHQHHHHHQPELRRVGQCVRRCKDDDGAARPAHPSLPHR
jgi:DNA replication protein DnaC